MGTLALPGRVSLTGAQFHLKRSSTATTVAGSGTFSYLSASMSVNGSLTMATAGPSGSLTVTIPAATKLGPFTVGGTFGLAFTPTAASVSVQNTTVKLDGWSQGVAVSGTLDTAGLGTITITTGSTPLTFSGTPFSIGGTFTLTRTATTTTATGTNLSLAWSGVGSFTVPSMTITSAGGVNVTLAAKNFTIPGGMVFEFGGGSFVTDPNALAAHIVMNTSKLSLPGITTSATKLTIPGFTISVGDFSVALLTDRSRSAASR